MLSNVNTALSGFVRANNGLRFIQDRNCIIRREDQLSEGKVKLISGGGGGHEPAHNGYVGKGMLDGAVCGDVFCSPSATSILDCLRMVAKPHESVLFIINNYTGDRLNFGLAIERARLQYGYENLKILLVNDDCSILDSMTKKAVGKRGLAGCVLMIKILGAMAELGRSMDQLVNLGEQLLRDGDLVTFGATFDVIDGKLRNIELGKGLHGEPGVYKADMYDEFEPILYFALDRIAGKIYPYIGANVVVLVNNLGGTSEFMMGIFMKALMTLLANDYTVRRVYVGNFFTSLNQCGLSITLLCLDHTDNANNLMEYLDYEVQVASPLFGGLKSYDLPPSEVLKFEDRLEFNVAGVSREYKIFFNESTQLMIKNILKHIANALISSRELLNTYDKECGDGDTGTTIANGAQALLASLDSDLELRYPAKMLHDISMLLQHNVGGTSGALYSLFFQGASQAFIEADNDPKLSVKHWLWALTYGNEAIVKYAYAKLGDRTMLDPLKEGEFELRDSVLQHLPTLGNIEKFAKACRIEAARTKKMLPSAGRASYCVTETGKSEFEHPDPGAHAVSIWAWALYEGYKEHCAE